VKKNISLNITLSTKKHMDSFATPSDSLAESPRRETGAQKLLRLAQEEEDAKVREMERIKRLIENEKRQMSHR